MRGMSQRQMQIQTAIEVRCGAELQCACASTTMQLIAPQQSNPGATFSTAETDAQMP